MGSGCFFEILLERTSPLKTPQTLLDSFQGPWHDCESRTRISPPSIHSNQRLHWSHNDIPSIQNKHVITNLRLIDAICVPCLLGFSWSRPGSSSHRPGKPQGAHSLAPGRMPLAVPLTLQLQAFPPPHPLSTLRLWTILKWVSSGMRWPIELHFALSKCLFCVH